ncbi:phage tail protein [Salmonella enterica]|nr:phage tail protein [Salmonella enterica subsp. enterica serovar Muenster]EFV3843358.1 phage tail protein [Salmonella enterica]EHK5343828.1 phage tail protein [Salmonella enterica]EHY4695502.1 phage tail protein [Salmonella enterica]EID9483227.1 phage tail protein [Salmonella enterica subsp. enterica serovar Muenster]
MPAFPKFKTIITDYGKQRLIAAMSPGGTKLTLTQMAVGDGGGNPTNPDTTSTTLVNEVWRAAVNSVTVDKKHPNIIIVELLIPAEVGGFWVREAGIYDEFNKLVAICSLPASEKPLLEQGSGRAQTVRMTLIVSDTSIVNITIDSTTIMATNEYVDNSLEEHEKSRNHPDATLTDKGFTKLYSGVTSIDETMAATPKAVKIAMDNASARLAKERNLADLTNIPLARQSLQLGNSATLNVGTTANTVAAGDDSRITGAMQKDQNGADIPDKPGFIKNVGLTETVKQAAGAVPSTRKINNHALDKDLSLTPGDIGALPVTGGKLNGPLGIGTDNALGGNSIVFGDNDTGFKWHSDGVLGIYANSALVGYIDNSGLHMSVDVLTNGGIRAGDGKRLSLTSNNNSTMTATFNLWGDANRPTVIELDDDQGWHLYSQRNPDGSIVFTVNGDITANILRAGEAIYQNNGDIFGSVWNGWLSTHLNNFVADVQLGAGTSVTTWNNAGSWPNTPGYVVTSVWKDYQGENIDGINYAPLQKRVGNQWYTVQGGTV